jgi:hypothetical protein
MFNKYSLILTKMKKVVVVFLLTIILIPSGIAGKLISSGHSFTKFGKYKIEIAESPFILNGKELKTYLITYENAGFTLQVTAEKSGDEIIFLALSDALSVQYVSHQTYFGVEKIDQKYVGSALKTADTSLNRNEFFHQKVLTSWEVSELEKISLIAAYYPALLNNIENLLSVK